MSCERMRRSLVLFSSILLSRLGVLTSGSQLGRDVPDRRSRPFFDLHRNRDHPVSALGVLGDLLHHLAVARALSHEAATGYQIGAPEFSRHWRTLLQTVHDLPDEYQTLCGRAAAGDRGASRSAPARPRPRPPSYQAALTSIILGTAARGAGILTSSMPFAYFASTWAPSTPSGSAELRSKPPYATSRTK